MVLLRLRTAVATMQPYVTRTFSSSITPLLKPHAARSRFNAARCVPSRSSLLQRPHCRQTSQDSNVRSWPGTSLNDWCPPATTVFRRLEIDTYELGPQRQRSKATLTGRMRPTASDRATHKITAKNRSAFTRHLTTFHSLRKCQADAVLLDVALREPSIR
jgi:hypothetical protein